MSDTNGVNGHTNGVNGHANGTSMPALSTTAEDFLQHKYDFIIVGGGTAGLTVAARLTENADVTVGVLEAGKNKLDDPLIDTPAAFLQLFNNPEYDWAFMTEPQKHNQNKTHHIPRGKVLGGSSGINYMMYVRGSDADYDDWAAITGDPSWGSENMKQYMRKHQTLEPIEDSVIDRSTMPHVGKHHGTSGPVRTSFNTTQMPIEDDFIKACDEVTGFDKKPTDPWSGDHIGFFNTLGSVARTGPNKGKRSYAARGYFAPNAQRPNLHVLCEATVSSVALDGDKATGVNFIFQGTHHTVKVQKEVIVSCGALQTPQILELSGIGDPDVLRKAGVACRVENPGVGNNFQDHPISVVAWELTPGNTSLDIIHNPDVMAAVQKQYMETQSGPMSHIASMQGFFPYKLFANNDEQREITEAVEESMSTLTPFQRKQYERTLQHLKDDKSANLQMVLIPATGDFEHGVADQSRLFVPPSPPDAPHQLTAAMCVQYPLSRGSIHIKSSDPFQHPAVDPNFMAHPADALVLAAGLKMLDGVSESKALQGKLQRRVVPRGDFDLKDTKQGEKWAREWCLSEYHPCGSCAMGDAVDSRLKVNGTRGLRVVDGSVFPNHVSGNMVSSVYMVAERAADIIKEDWDNAALAKVS
ncbi:hypothetical protein LTR56_022714 [Elasticomyces elasticus]|nr:hypothetical protein LTR56_022714 [Elasticomyces elasticus]KAK3641698.1 hypothetical protein LTR22_016406 [Elasticomyces elasticus]KAK4917292.1 hypothetical protein LTR49_014776 [Elasticomyces elasticus]KAK5764891.1 hypothetical protein LTS12_004918 [Elasticomyces elasticus]